MLLLLHPLQFSFRSSIYLNIYIHKYIYFNNFLHQFVMLVAVFQIFCFVAFVCPYAYTYVHMYKCSCKESMIFFWTQKENIRSSFFEWQTFMRKLCLWSLLRCTSFLYTVAMFYYWLSKYKCLYVNNALQFKNKIAISCNRW